VNLKDKYNLLVEILGGLGRVVVAYSGGVDSSFLLKVAVETLGAENVLACISAGPSLAKSQYDRALATAEEIGATVKTIETDEMADAKFTANNADRCFHCKSHLLKALADIAKEKNFDSVIVGNNFDDGDDFRPGSRAVKLFGARCPLAQAKLTKEDIRQLSRELDLPTADMPAWPCLASRISYGQEITGSRLNQIEQAEEFLRGLGLVEFRVRVHDNIARIEVKLEDMEKVTREPAISAIVKKLKSLGFEYITVDLQGFRSGSLNESLSAGQKRKALGLG